MGDFVTLDNAIKETLEKMERKQDEKLLKQLKDFNSSGKLNLSLKEDLKRDIDILKNGVIYGRGIAEKLTKQSKISEEYRKLEQAIKEY